jgi:hypothetical protein
MQSMNMRVVFAAILSIMLVCPVGAQAIITPGKKPGTYVVTTPRDVSVMPPPSGKVYKVYTPYVNEKSAFLLQIEEFENGISRNNPDTVVLTYIGKGQRTVFEIIPEQIQDTTLRITFNFPGVQAFKYFKFNKQQKFKWKKFASEQNQNSEVSVPVMIVYKDDANSGNLEKAFQKWCPSEEIPVSQDKKKIYSLLKNFYIISYCIKK